MIITNREERQLLLFHTKDATYTRLFYRDEVMWFIVEMGNMERLNIKTSNNLERQYQQRWLEKKDLIEQ